MRQGGKKQIAEVVACEPAAGAETILKKPAEQRFILGKRHHAIANVSRGQNTILATQTAGTSTVVGDGDDGGKINDGTLRGRIRIVARNNVLLQPAKKRGETGTAAKSNHANPAR